MSLKKLMLVPVILTMLLSVKMTGNECYSNCYQNSDCCDCLCSGWGVYADWLYWRARRCQLDYATTATFNNGAIDGLIGEIYGVEPAYESGYRVGIYKECDCFFFDAFYTSFCDKECDSVYSASDLVGTRFATLTGTLNNPTSEIVNARAKWDLNYDVVDVLVGYNLCSSCCFDTYVFGGFKYASIGQEFCTTYEGTIGMTAPQEFNPTVYNAIRVKQKLDMDAYGVAFGLGAKYTLCGCFDFFGRFSYDLLLGNFDRKFSQSTAPAGTPTSPTPFTQAIHVDDCCWLPVDVVNFALGFTYNYDFCGCWVKNIGISIAYEFHHWINMMDFIDIGILTTAPAPMLLDRHLQSFGLDGLTIRFAFDF